MLTFPPPEATILTLLAEATKIDDAAKRRLLDGLSGSSRRIGEFLITPDGDHELSPEELETANYLLGRLAVC